MSTPNVEEFPVFIRSYEDLNDHLHSELSDLSNSAKGRIFAQFMSSIIPLSDHGAQFGEIAVGPDSHDGGIDLRADGLDENSLLYAQSKLTLRGVDDIDLIMSKFQSYQSTHHTTKNGQMEMFGQDVDIYFMIVTLSKIKNKILPDYEKSSRASKKFYDDLKRKGRIIILDGPEVLPLVQSAYRKQHIVPSNVELHLESPFIHQGNVYIGVISADKLKNCYRKFGDALFLENIRTFLGYSNSSRKDRDVNDAIKETAENSPEEMLARNNGITFRAKDVSIINEKTLLLDHASIVNGCQTTMCIVHASRSDALILIKIVEVSDSWAIAKAANFQNRVEQVALDLARYVRPQAVKLAASRAGIHVDDKNGSLYDVMKSIYQDNVRYDEIYYLFMGIFSRRPNNVINKNYAELRSDLMENFQARDPLGEAIFDVLFKLYKSARDSQELVEKKYISESYKNIFQRFWRDNKPDYRSMITILAACGCVRINIYDSADMTGLQKFLDDLRSILENDSDKFKRYYQYAFETIGNYLLVSNSNKQETEILRTMFDDLRATPFETLYRQICMIADGREIQ